MHYLRLVLILILIIPSIILQSCATTPRYYFKPRKVASQLKNNNTKLENTDYIQVGDVFVGNASFYGYEFAGRKTASGEDFDPEGLTAAHRTWPFGTIVEVTSLKTNKSVIVRINDRGPFTECLIDLSYGAAKQIGMLSNSEVKLKIIQVGNTQ